MVYAGLDVHKRCTQICIEDESGTLLERRILTERHRLLEEFSDKPRMRILLESATESEWVARCLESVGHEVIVGDPNFAPMYAQRSRRIKTDRRDARALMEACKLGAYKQSHRCSDVHKLRARISARDLLVQTRTKCISSGAFAAARGGHGLRFRMAFNPDVTGLALRTFVSVVSPWLRRRARAVGIRGLLKTGGVTVIQRFGSALNLNVHFHTLMIDGVYELWGAGFTRNRPNRSPSDTQHRYSASHGLGSQRGFRRATGAPPRVGIHGSGLRAVFAPRLRRRKQRDHDPRGHDLRAGSRCRRQGSACVPRHPIRGAADGNESVAFSATGHCVELPARRFEIRLALSAVGPSLR